MAKKQTRRKRATPATEFDSLYMLKLVLYLILGSQWLRITRSDSMQIPIPIGFLLGLLFARHEHFQIDRKVEYAILLLTMFIAFWLPIGLVVGIN